VEQPTKAGPNFWKTAPCFGKGFLSNAEFLRRSYRNKNATLIHTRAATGLPQVRKFRLASAYFWAIDPNCCIFPPSGNCVLDRLVSNEISPGSAEETCPYRHDHHEPLTLRNSLKPD